jgi:hypothetical protein
VLLDNRRDELVFERQPKVVQDAPACECATKLNDASGSASGKTCTASA